MNAVRRVATENDSPFEHPRLQHGYPLDSEERAVLKEALRRRHNAEAKRPSPADATRNDEPRRDAS